MISAIGYGALVAIWSTTPLAIKWSALEMSFAGAIFWRIFLSAVLALIILRVRGESLWGYRYGLRFYTIAALGIAPNFLLVYWASLSISSGLISVIFSTTPFLMGVLSYYWLGKQVFTTQRVVALIIAIVGLLVVFADQLVVMGSDGVYGLLAMLLSLVIFAVSSTMLQKIDQVSNDAALASIPVLQKTAGGLCFSVPMLGVAWLYLDGSSPVPISWQGGLSVLYLSVFGSLLGFALYYFLLHRLSAYVVSTVGMISPVFALILGYWLDDELLTSRLIVGAGLVLFGLTLYHMRISSWRFLWRN